ISRDTIHGDTRTGRLNRINRGVYRIPTAADDGLVPLRAAYLHLGPESTAVLGAAQRLFGIQGADGTRPPEFALPPGLEKRQRADLRLRFWRIPEDERTTTAGIPVTNVHRTLADSCRLLSRTQAVSSLDSALFLGLIRPEELPALAALMARKPNCVAGRRRLLEARVGAQSPLETRVRLRANDAGLRPDALQVPIHSGSGALLGYGDMGYRLPRGGWLIVEADGRFVHELPAAVLHDRHRQNSFLSHGNADIVRFTWSDTIGTAYVPSVLGPILNSAGWRPNQSRS
ncbi:MAG: hypothetical protein NTX29_14995, partial [Actinobacteria bacterium]|nr:hypothetical protein [Actinomycetota bacterium]